MAQTAGRTSRRAALILATGLGIGYAPVAPGTWGSLLGLFLVWFLEPLRSQPLQYVAVTVSIVVSGVFICGRAAEVLGERDPGAVVFDEIAAMPVVFLVVPFSLLSGAVGFAAFRFFDILKPWPVRWFERLPSGWGIMADDVAAAVYAGACLWIVDLAF